MGPQGGTYTRPRVSRHGLQVLQKCLGLKGSHDSVLVAIDFENTGNLINGFRDSEDSQAGLAILDTRDLDGTDSWNITTYNFITGSVPYTTKSSERFLFGQSVAIKTADILEQMYLLIPRDRDIILIGHSVVFELMVLHALGFDFTSRRVIAIVDTIKVATEVFGYWSLSLGELLSVVGCPFSELHNGGNDAHFTLKAALFLADQGCRQQHSESPALVEALEEKRRQKSRRLQSRSWNAEEHDRIRAERAARRAETESRALL